jgi:hypothetical protein
MLAWSYPGSELKKCCVHFRAQLNAKSSMWVENEKSSIRNYH